MKGLLEAQSPRLSNIAEKMKGASDRNYKTIERFVKAVELKQILLRFYQEEAEFVIEDPTGKWSVTRRLKLHMSAP